MNSKKLLMVGWFFYPKLGGAESLMLEQARFFVSNGYDVTVLTSWPDGFPQQEIFDGIKIFRTKNWNSSVDCSKELTQELKPFFDENKFDLVHFHNGSYPAASTDLANGAKNVIAVFKLARENGAKIIEHSHNAQLREPENTKVLRDLSWDAIIFVSRFAKKSWDDLGYNCKKGLVIYNGIDLKRFTKQKPNNVKENIRGKKIIFFPGRVLSMTKAILNPQKNYDKVLQACAELKKTFSDFILLCPLNKPIIPEYVEEASNLLKIKIKEYDIENNIYFLDEIKPQEMPSLYAASDVVFVPSLNETFGLVYLEGMASSRVVIASNTGAPNEYIKNGVNGFLVGDDIKEMSKILERILTDDVLKGGIEHNAFVDAQKFSLEHMMEQVELVYKELL